MNTISPLRKFIMMIAITIMKIVITMIVTQRKIMMMHIDGGQSDSNDYNRAGGGEKQIVFG